MVGSWRTWWFGSCRPTGRTPSSTASGNSAGRVWDSPDCGDFPSPSEPDCPDCSDFLECSDCPDPLERPDWSDPPECPHCPVAPDGAEDIMSLSLFVNASPSQWFTSRTYPDSQDGAFMHGSCSSGMDSEDVSVNDGKTRCQKQWCMPE